MEKHAVETEIIKRVVPDWDASGKLPQGRVTASPVTAAAHTHKRYVLRNADGWFYLRPNPGRNGTLHEDISTATLYETLRNARLGSVHAEKKRTHTRDF